VDVTGLDIEVGIVADLKRNDPEGYQHLREEFQRLNQFLLDSGLEQHREPEDLLEEQVFSCQMWGYSGLHRLRRLAAHLALGGPLPDPVNSDASKDPIVERYYALASGSQGFLARLLRNKQDKLQFEHLMMHSDAEGYYLPQDFSSVLYPDEQMKIAGAMVGSAPRLLEECRRLAAAIKLPTDLDHESDELWGAADQPDLTDASWKRYGVEAFSCLRLIRGCEASLATGAALVFC